MSLNPLFYVLLPHAQQSWYGTQGSVNNWMSFVARAWFTEIVFVKTCVCV